MPSADSSQVVRATQKEALSRKYRVFKWSGVASAAPFHFLTGCTCSCKNGCIGNHLVRLGKGARPMSVDACLENGKEVFGHCIVVAISAS